VRNRRFVLVEPVISNDPKIETKYVYLVIDPISQSIGSFNSPDEAWDYIHGLENPANFANQEKADEDDTDTPVPS
jgi:hypothetical protein